MHYFNSTTASCRKPRNPDGTMRFGIFWPKAKTMLPSALMAERNPDPLDLEVHLELARACEAVGLDFTLIGDGYAPSSEEGSLIGFQDPSLHALVIAAPLMMVTRHLGVITTMHTPFLAPAQIARFGSHFDWLSGGRWGWNIVNGYRDYESSLFGIDQLPDSAAQYEACADAIRIIEAIWRESKVDFTGKYYKARGKMRGPFPPERPVFVCAAASERGRAFTARHCEFLFASPPSLADLPEVKASLEKHAKEAGREYAPEVLVVADVLIRDKPGEGKKLMDELMGSMTGPAGERWRAQMARLRRNEATPEVFPSFAGTAEEVADEILEARERWGLNGVLFRFPLWSAEEMLRLNPVFDRLAKAGVWVPPEQRNFSW